MKNGISKLALALTLILTGVAPAADPPKPSDSVQGTYKAVLLHEASPFYQFANITLRTISTAGQLKISANVRVFFGDWDSNEFLTYEFDDVPYNFLTGQMSIKSTTADVSMVGIFKPAAGTLEGEWYSTLIGRVGKFTAKKAVAPETPKESQLVRTLTGYYRGALKNTNPQSNLPERATISFVTTQDTTGTAPVIKISGNVRLYLGDFDSFEYVETKLTEVNFNFYNRYLTARTADYGLTFKGTVGHDGNFKGIVFADGIGEAASADLKRYP